MSTDAETPKIGVIAADDQPLMREALRGAILGCESLELVALLHDGGSAWDAIQQHTPDIALLDVEMPGIDGLQVAREILAASLPTRVLFLSAHTDGDTLVRALGVGAAGFLSKSTGPVELQQAILAVSRGESVLPPELVGALAGTMRQTATAGALTDRELNILRLIVSGATAREIAAELNLAVSTVKTHTNNVYRKLNVTHRAAAVAEAMRRGLAQ
jgi:two-component system nitrate/nitrite response regulator NarL